MKTNTDIIIPKGMPKPIAEMAKKIHTKWLSGEIRPRRATSSNDIHILEVSRCYRMVQLRGRNWQLMSHESYNKVFKNMK